MRIRIDFAEADKFLFVANIPSESSTLMEILGKELEQVLIDDYFSGADKAVIFIGYSLDNEYFEFDLIPN